MVGGFGRSIGPLIGGYLSHPDQTFPRIFSADSILARFPFALPCLFIFTYSLIIIALTYAYLPETISVKSKAGFLTVPQVDPNEASSSLSNTNQKTNKEAVHASSLIENGGAGAKNRVSSSLEDDETNFRSSVGSLLKDPAIITVVVSYGLVSLIQVTYILVGGITSTVIIFLMKVLFAEILPLWVVRKSGLNLFYKSFFSMLYPGYTQVGWRL